MVVHTLHTCISSTPKHSNTNAYICAKQVHFFFFFLLHCCSLLIRTLLLYHQPYLIVEAEGWWNKSEVLEACQVGQALSKKFIINSVTYLGNSHNNVTPAVDNWSCIVGGLLCLLSSIYFKFLLCVNCNTKIKSSLHAHTISPHHMTTSYAHIIMPYI